MNDFKSYTNEQTQKKPPEEATQAPNGTAEMINVLAKAFQGKSEADIWKTILAQAEQGKRDGTLSNEDLDTFYATLSPLLDGFRKQKLKSIIAKLKNL